MFYHKKQTKTDLEAMRGIIEKYGWTQDKLGDETIGFCLLGANYHHLVVNEHDANARRFNRIEQAIIDVNGGMSVDIWNDAPGRTKEEVLALLDKAIETV